MAIHVHVHDHNFRDYGTSEGARKAAESRKRGRLSSHEDILKSGYQHKISEKIEPGHNEEEHWYHNPKTGKSIQRTNKGITHYAKGHFHSQRLSAGQNPWTGIAIPKKKATPSGSGLSFWK